VPAGAVVEIGAIRGGARTYVAVAGGVDAALVLGSASTDLTAGIGGVDGRPLRKDDVLPIGGASATGLPRGDTVAHGWVSEPPHLPIAAGARLRILPGAHAAGSRETLCAREWRVSASASRMGLRLEGEGIPGTTPGLTSEPVATGTVQLPPDGQPIVLGVEAQTVGGYPRIAHVIAADWPVLGQLRPGDRVRFVPVGDVEAASALLSGRTWLARAAEAIAAKRAG
jgi:antagonist of KipI